MNLMVFPAVFPAGPGPRLAVCATIAVALLAGCTQTRVGVAGAGYVTQFEPEAAEMGYTLDPNGARVMGEAGPEVWARVGSGAPMVSVAHVDGAPMTMADEQVAIEAARAYCVKSGRKWVPPDGNGQGLHAFLDDGIWKVYRVCK